MIELRPYQPSDAPPLLALFKETIRRVNARDYNPEQIRAWASDEIDLTAWTERFVGRYAVVAIDGEQFAGFTELETDGHIDRFYVSADHQGQGIGRQMLAAIVAEAKRQGIARLYLEASITARPFFASRGFRTIAQQVVTARGVDFVNYRMEHIIAAG